MPSESSVETSGGVRLGILRRAWSRLPLRYRSAIFLLVADHRAKARSIGREFRSLRHRIRVLFSERTWRCGPDIGPGWERDEAGCLVECKQTHACMTGIESLERLYPWVTMFDVTVFLHGWRMGVQWAADNQNSDRRSDRQNEMQSSTAASPVPPVSV